MHPWSMQRLAQERSLELVDAACRARASRQARRVGPTGATVVTTRATRYLGELLIRTGWRLVGPDAPGTGVRARVVLRSSGGAAVDPC